MKFRIFLEFSVFSWNWSCPRRRCENVDIPKGILMILRCPSLQNRYFLWKVWISWNSLNFLKIMEFYEIPRFCGNVDFCSETHPRIINIPLGISTFPASGPGKLEFHHKSRNSMIFWISCWNSNIRRNLKISCQNPAPRAPTRKHQYSLRNFNGSEVPFTAKSAFPQNHDFLWNFTELSDFYGFSWNSMKISAL